MNKNRVCAAIAAAAGSFVGAASYAGVIGTAGALSAIPAPPSLFLGQLESNSEICLIAEQQGLLLPVGLSVDATASGMYASSASLMPGLIAAGTSVSSYLLHMDPFGSPPNGLLLSGSVTFDQDILGVIVTTSLLDASDALLGNLSTMYQLGNSRGLELDTNDDHFSISADRRTLSIQMEAWNLIDQIRVVVAAPVPTPGAMALLAAGTAVGVRRRRR